MHAPLEQFQQVKRLYEALEKYPESLELIDAAKARVAEVDFWKYRQFMNPGMLKGWWQEEVATELQKFVMRFKAGQAPKLLLQAPRQHGKSLQVFDTIAWLVGQMPDINVIFTSYSERLGVRANLRMQRILDSARYKEVFQDTCLSDGRGTYLRNHNILEFVGKDGSFRNTTVGGRVTGESLDLGIVDDPIKGREEAESELIREKTWEWFTDDFMGCFSNNAALLVIMTRWHVDDPAGRMLELMPGLKVLRYPAIAEEDEVYRKKGEALFPELKSLRFLLERKQVLSQSSFESIYQQNPIIVGGSLFPIEKFEIVGGKGTKPAPGPKDIKRTVRYWDKAGTEGGGAFTCGVLMHQLHNKKFYVSDVRRGQWSALDRENYIKQTSIIDRNAYPFYKIYVEQEPGSGGKESSESTIRNLAGFTVEADRVTGKKEFRADPYAAQVQGGNVCLYAADWNLAYINEAEQFPNGKYKDQIDASSGAFNKLTLGAQYDSSLSWVG